MEEAKVNTHRGGLGLEEAMRRRAARVERLSGQIDALGAQKFGNKITFEIGCGKGHYLSAYGAKFKGEMCVGIDLISSRVRDGGRKNERLGNSNVFFIKAECSEFLDALKSKNIELKKIFIFFPDPWPKKRHHRRRLIQDEFLANLKGFCAPEAVLYFRTDHSEYFNRAKEAFLRSPDWEVLADSSLPFEEVSQFQRLLPVFSTLAARLKS